MKNTFCLILIVTATAISMCHAGDKTAAGNQTPKIKNDLTIIKLRGKVKSVTTVEYDADSTGKEELKAKTITLYNAQGNRTQELDYKADGTLKINLTQQNDSSGHHTGGITYDSTGKNVIEKIAFKYDDEDNLIAMMRFHANGQPDGRVTRTLDDKGNTTEEKYFSVDTDYVGRRVFKYDVNNNRIEESLYTTTGFLVSHYVNTYDAKGLPATEVGSTEPGIAPSTLSMYFKNIDKNGNWLNEVELKNGKPYKRFERVIEYY